MLSGFDHELYPRRVPLSYTKQKTSNYLNSHGEPEAQLREATSLKMIKTIYSISD